MRRLPLLIAAVALAIAAAVAIGALATGSRSETGLVTAIEDRSLTEVDGFTLRTAEGRQVVFRVGRLELDAGAFPAGHLREHLTLGQPIVVRFREENGQRIAYRLEDAVPAST